MSAETFLHPPVLPQDGSRNFRGHVAGVSCTFRKCQAVWVPRRSPLGLSSPVGGGRPVGEETEAQRVSGRSGVKPEPVSLVTAVCFSFFKAKGPVLRSGVQRLDRKT